MADTQQGCCNGQLQRGQRQRRKATLSSNVFRKELLEVVCGSLEASPTKRTWQSWKTSPMASRRHTARRGAITQVKLACAIYGKHKTIYTKRYKYTLYEREHDNDVPQCMARIKEHSPV